MTNTSIWFDVELPTFSSLSGNITTDVAIIGGGIHGLVTAYLLAKAGKKVVLVEQNQIAHGDTGYTTAFVSYVIDKDLQAMAEQFGREKAQQVWQAGHSAIDILENIIKEEKIECDFERTDLTIYATSQEGVTFLHKEQELADKLGFTLKLNDADYLPIKNEGSLITPRNAKFHPLKFVAGVANRATKLGAQIFEETRVTDIKHGKTITVNTNSGRIVAQHLVAATGAPINSPLFLQAKIKPTNTYVIAGEIDSAALAPGLYIDTLFPYHYLRIDAIKKGARFILGGEDHPTGESIDSKKTYQKLIEYLHSHLTNGFSVTHQWSGQILTSVDGLPYIGRHPLYRNELVGTCFGGDGMTFGVLSAAINTDLILNKATQLASLFNPSRFSGFWEFMKHGLEIGKAMMISHLPSKKKDFSQLKSGEGMVTEQDGHKVAVSKNEKGEVVAVSAVCTHMGCIVNWNGVDKTWDCPCHGSRFAADGEVIRGPAVKPLVKEHP